VVDKRFSSDSLIEGELSRQAREMFQRKTVGNHPAARRAQLQVIRKDSLAQRKSLGSPGRIKFQRFVAGTAVAAGVAVALGIFYYGVPSKDDLGFNLTSDCQ